MEIARILKIWAITETLLDLLQKIQNRAGRVILKVNPFSHTSTFQVHDTLKWDYLDTRQKRHLQIMVYKVVNDLCPEYMKEKLQVKRTNYCLRAQGQLNLPKPQTNSCKRTFFYRGSDLYNSLPNSVRNAESLRTFNSLLGQFRGWE